MTQDMKQFATPVEWLKHLGRIEPTFLVSMAKVSAEAAFRWTQPLRSLSIPLSSTPLIGCDGTIHELELGNPFVALSVRWWCDGPPEWAPLTGHFAEFLKWASGLDGWGQVPATDCMGGVRLVAVWGTDRPSLDEVRALRVVLPEFAAKPLQELVRTLPYGRLEVGVLPFARAEELQRRAHEQGLRIDLSPQDAP